MQKFNNKENSVNSEVSMDSVQNSCQQNKIPPQKLVFHKPNYRKMQC